MGEEIHFENGRIFNFQGLATLTLTLDRVIRHTIVHHSLTSTYMLNFIRIGENFLWTDGRIDVHRYASMDIETCFIRSTQRSRPKKHLISTKCNKYAYISLLKYVHVIKMETNDWPDSLLQSAETQKHYDNTSQNFTSQSYPTVNSVTIIKQLYSKVL